MTQSERRKWLIEYLLKESDEEEEIPTDEYSQRRFLRGLMNVRQPVPASEEFYTIQDEYLKAELQPKITDFESLSPVSDDASSTDHDLYVWKGDITTLKIDAIVNAANSGMTGCWGPNHACIDNAIHTFAGIQLRACCAEIMKKQGFPEPTGKAKITPAFNLPSKFVIHTVGPICSWGGVTQQNKADLKSSYESCLKIAEENGVKSIAFCCISTGVFSFPNEQAAEIAVETVRTFKRQTGSKIKVVFNVFGDKDLKIYEKLLSVEKS